jgi:hypothetical protein
VIKVRLTNTEDHTERVMTKTFVFR